MNYLKIKKAMLHEIIKYYALFFKFDLEKFQQNQKHINFNSLDKENEF